MRDEEKSKKQLIAELINLRKTLTECKLKSAELKRAQKRNQDHLEELVKNRTEELRKANKLIINILSNITDGFLILDKELKCIYMNKVFQTILGRSQEDLLGRVIWDKLPNENPAFYENFKVAMNSQNQIHFEAFSLIINCWIEVDIYPSEVGVSALFRDITDRKKAEEDMRLSKELFSTTFDFSPIMMSLNDLKTGQFVKVNRIFEQTTGYTSNEIIGKTSDDLNLLVKKDDETSTCDIFSENGQINIQNKEINFKIKSGYIRTGLFSTHIIKVNKTELLLIGAIDITELQQFRKEAGRLDRLDLIGQMAAAISHEVRNPLTVVKGFLQMFTTKPKFFEENEYFQLMISELDRANSIITDFLSVSRTKKSEFMEINLNKIVEFIFPLIYADALQGDKNILLDLNLIPDLKLDKEEIKQLVLNLVRNGLEAMTAGGCIKISTRSENEDIVLSIQDEGHGLPQEILNQIGTPFITTKANGTGLGLAVCYGIVSKHEGKINIETSPKGTIFNVRFPTRKGHRSLEYQDLQILNTDSKVNFG